MRTGRPSFRTTEVLGYISKYGVISTSVLLEITSDKIPVRWMRRILHNLKKKKLIVCATSAMKGSPVDYWMLSKVGIAKLNAGGIAGVAPYTSRTKSAKYTHYPHEDLCTLFQVSMERKLQSLQVFREATGTFKNVPEQILSRRLIALGYAPDLVLRTQINPGKWIAIEIDRTCRTLKRLSQRVNMYARHTGFEGLLYLMPDEGMLESLVEVYESRGAKDAFRIKGGSDAFLACGICPSSLFDVRSLNVFVSGDSVSFVDWLSIVTNENLKKRDEKLSDLSSTGGQKSSLRQNILRG